MSFRLFIYYCAAWGGAAAFFGWILGRWLTADESLTSIALKGMSLGMLVAFGLGIVDALASGSQGDRVGMGIRILLALIIGALGGLIGGFIGQGLYQWTGGKFSALLILGWTLTGLLIGLAPSAFDYLVAVLRKEDRQGANRKLRNGLIGGTVGGLVGGIVYMAINNLWEGVFIDSYTQDLWSPSATGFVVLGACIGLAIALTQVILREAWLRVEAGFRPGRQLLLTRPETLIGRAESCDVGMFGDAAVDKLHAKITRQGNLWVLHDSGSSAGTFLNGQRISQPSPLKAGDRIQVGNSTLSFEVRSKQPAAAPPAAVPLTS